MSKDTSVPNRHIQPVLLASDNAQFTASIAVIEGLHAKSMRAFLNKKQLWRGANFFLHADNVSPSYWKKRNDLPKVAP